MKYFILAFVSLFLQISLFAQPKCSEAFLLNIQRGKLDSSYFYLSAEVKQVLQAKQFNRIWKKTQSKFGKMTGFEFFNEERKDNLKIYKYNLFYKKDTIGISLTVFEEKEIKGFFLSPKNERVEYLLPNYCLQSRFQEIKDSILLNEIYVPIILTIPNAPFSTLCIFIPGSGAQDIDATVGPNKIFRDISVGMSSNSIATLRFAKTNVTNNKDKNLITIEDEYLIITAKILEYIATNTLLKEKHIYIVGHSLGGRIAPNIAGQNKQTKGIILLAANSRPLDSLLIDQLKYISMIHENSTQDQIDIVVVEKKMKYLRDSLTTESNRDQLPFNIPASYWISLNHINPIKMIDSLNLPTLILQGERDYQVTMVDFKLFQQLLRNNKNVSFHSYPALNHLFLEGTEKSMPSEYLKFSNVPHYLILDITNWINSTEKK